MRKFSILMALVGLLLLPLSADAKPKKNEGTFSEQQTMLNNQAAEATRNGEFAKAEKLFVAMLAIGEFDLVWLNLARTYARENKCLEAEEAYTHVLGAKQLKGYRDQIEKLYPGYVEELKTQCNAQIRLECTPADMTITIDGGVERKCDPNAVYNLVPGQHMFVGTATFSSSEKASMNSIVVTARANELITGSLVIEDEEEKTRREAERARLEAEKAKELQNIIENNDITLEDFEKKSFLFKALGYSFIGGGALILGGGIGMTLYYYYDYQDLYDQNKAGKIDNSKLNRAKKNNQKYMNGGYAMMAVGGSMLVAGVALVVIDAVRYQPQIETLKKNQRDAREEQQEAAEPVTTTDSFGFAPVVNSDFAGFTLFGTF